MLPTFATPVLARNNNRVLRGRVHGPSTSVTSALALVIFGTVLGSFLQSLIHPAPFSWSTAPSPVYQQAAILVSYAYYEKDNIQAFNLDFFLQAGWQPSPTGQHITWAFVTSTGACTPCNTYLKNLVPEEAVPEHGIQQALYSQERHTYLLTRSSNTGMDVGSHNATLQFLAHRGLLRRFAYFIFINSSTKGPFYPTYIPADWHWTHAFVNRMTPLVHAVGSSLVCLPAQDAGGPGPRLESWAFALSATGLRLATTAGVFAVRTCKHCTDAEDGIIVGGEYRLTSCLLDADYNVATLMSKYAAGVDWREKQHWNCNDNVHPSRHGTYDGIAFHPYETVFVKSSWHVADPYTRRYSTWRVQHLEGDAGTEGEFNEHLYRYAISAAALKPNLLEAAYNITRVMELQSRQTAQGAKASEAGTGAPRPLPLASSPALAVAVLNASSSLVEPAGETPGNGL